MLHIDPKKNRWIWVKLLREYLIQRKIKNYSLTLTIRTIDIFVED